jgi:ABC-2 type transport system permease protein
MLAVCLPTALSLRNSRWPIAAFDLPSAMSSSTSRSRGVSRPTGSLRALLAYRERGVLRRKSTTPVRPAALLAVQLAINAVVTVVATTLTLVLGHLVLDVPFPRAFFGFTVVVVLGSVAMFALGLFLAAVAPNSRVMQGVGAAALFPLLFFAGMWLPRNLMPEALRRVSDFTPTGAFGQGLVDTLGGHAPSALHPAVMAGWSVVAVIAATRSFRWQ